MKHQPVLVEIDGENHILPVGGEVASLTLQTFISSYLSQQPSKSYYIDLQLVLDMLK